MGKKQEVNLSDISLLILDVDGVLTDGTIVINGDGSESKEFNAYDGHGIRMWHRAGLKVAFLSGRFSEPTSVRAKQLDIDHCIQDCHDKLPSIKDLANKLRITPANIAYIGDDLPDLPVLENVGFGVAVNNAVDELKEAADYVTKKRGGSGAVREVIEYILKKTGRWAELMERYMP